MASSTDPQDTAELALRAAQEKRRKSEVTTKADAEANWSVRFWSWVQRGEGDECWVWQGTLQGSGYGRFYFRRRAINAHRVAWILTFGEIAEGLFVLHKCDNPKCVNPAHLFLGNQATNMQDAVFKGRLNNAMSRLTHCLAGHEYSEANTTRWPNGNRRCRACRVAAGKRQQARRRDRAWMAAKA